jgi:hypothetical protein
VSRWPILLIAPLIAFFACSGCDLFMKQLAKGPAPVDDGGEQDADPDGGGEYCPGYTGSSECCMVDDPCGWGGDGFCDCDGMCDWDIEDCGGDTDTDTDTDTGTDTDTDTDTDTATDADAGVWCVGYTGDDTCCLIDDPCEWAGDGVCDCDETCDWDWEDC